MTAPLLPVQTTIEAPAAAPSRRRVSWRSRFRRNSGAMVGLGIIVLLACVTISPSPFMTHDPNEQDLLHRFASVGEAGHWLGTDSLGRDLYSRLLDGIGVTVLAALLAVTVATLIGVPAGLVAGYRGGRLDRFFGAVSDGAMSIPAIIAVIAVLSALGPGLGKAMVTVGVFLSARMFRVQRATTISTRHETYIEASEALGCSTTRVLLRHVLPNSMSPTIVQATLIFGSAILAEAALSFVGLGVESPNASLGALIADAAPRLNQYPFLIVPPGVVAALTVLAFALVGEGLKDDDGRTNGGEVTAMSAAAQRVAIDPMDRPLLEVEGLTVQFSSSGSPTTIVEDLSFVLMPHESLGIVGESGSGKSVSALACLGLIPAVGGRVVAGSVKVLGEEVLTMPRRKLDEVRGGTIGMVFQQPTRSLNPAFRVGDQIAETVRRHLKLNRRDAWERAVQMLDRVHIPQPEERASNYPHQFSGGRRSGS